MELVKELAVAEDKQKEEQFKKRIEELTGMNKDLQKQLKTSHENQKELKLLLDVFKGSVKESRSKVITTTGCCGVVCSTDRVHPTVCMYIVQF